MAPAKLDDDGDQPTPKPSAGEPASRTDVVLSAKSTVSVPKVSLDRNGSEQNQTPSVALSTNKECSDNNTSKSSNSLSGITSKAPEQAAADLIESPNEEMDPKNSPEPPESLPNTAGDNILTDAQSGEGETPGVSNDSAITQLEDFLTTSRNDLEDLTRKDNDAREAHNAKQRERCRNTPKRYRAFTSELAGTIERVTPYVERLDRTVIVLKENESQQKMMNDKFLKEVAEAKALQTNTASAPLEGLKVWCQEQIDKLTPKLILAKEKHKAKVREEGKGQSRLKSGLNDRYKDLERFMEKIEEAIGVSKDDHARKNSRVDPAPLEDMASPSTQDDDDEISLEAHVYTDKGHRDELTGDQAHLDPENLRKPSDCPPSLVGLYKSIDRAETAGLALKMAADSKSDEEGTPDVLDSIIRLEELLTSADGELEQISPRIAMEKGRYGSKEIARSKSDLSLRSNIIERQKDLLQFTGTLNEAMGLLKACLVKSKLDMEDAFKERERKLQQAEKEFARKQAHFEREYEIKTSERCQESAAEVASKRKGVGLEDEETEGILDFAKRVEHSPKRTRN